MRRLLFVAFFFPPIGGVSVPRSLGHARHLPEHGWEPVVLTPRRSTYHLQDPALLAAVPAGIQVLRTGIVEPQGIRRAVARIARPWHHGAPGVGESADVTGTGRLAAWRRRLFFPDDQVGWLPAAVRAGLNEHRRAPFSAVLSSSSPISAHLIAGWIARRTGLPWVAEFRDPWVGNALAHPASWMHRELARRLERWIVASAARSIFVTPSLTELYRRRYPDLADRFSTITNGYDLDAPQTAVGAAEAATPGTPITITYAGTLDRPAELSIFLEGLRRYCALGQARAPVRVEFIGHATEACRDLIAAAASALGAETVTHRGFVPRAEARRRLAAADGALILLGEGPGMGLFVGGKLYEYLGADRPIFAMLPLGDARDILTGLGWGTVASPSPQAVADALHRFTSERPRRAVADPERRFERAAVVADLVEVLDAAAEGIQPR